MSQCSAECLGINCYSAIMGKLFGVSCVVGLWVFCVGYSQFQLEMMY